MDALHGSSGAVSEYLDVLSPPRIAQFLAANHWTCQTDRQFDQTWLQPADVGSRIVPVLLPREPDFVDYKKSLVEAIETIARAYDWHVSTLAEQVAAIHADLFFIRVNQSSFDGTIPLKQATVLLDSIDQMIKSAAVQAYNPTSSGRGRLPVPVNDFMNDDVRMGHTKKGSFIITVAARIDGGVTREDSAAEQVELDGVAEERGEGQVVAADTSVRDERAEHEALSGEQVGAVSHSSEPASFTRQVMTTLARSLDLTRQQVSAKAVSSLQATAPEIRLPIVQALQDIGEAEGLQSIDMSFEWAAAEPQSSNVPSRIELNRNEIDALPELERRLITVAAPARTTVMGPVTELRRSDEEPEGGDDENGEIVVRAEIEGRVRRIFVDLSGSDYDWAIRAHRAKIPFTVTGELGKKGNSWRLNDPIEVDRSFLEFRLSDEGPTKAPPESQGR